MRAEVAGAQMQLKLSHRQRGQFNRFAHGQTAGCERRDGEFQLGFGNSYSVPLPSLSLSFPGGVGS